MQGKWKQMDDTKSKGKRTQSMVPTYFSVYRLNRITHSAYPNKYYNIYYDYSARNSALAISRSHGNNVSILKER